MPRGQTAEVGDTFVSANGYHHTRLESGWVATHRIVAEKKIGRPLGKTEIVRFADGNKENLDPGNLVIVPKKTSGVRRRIAQLEALIEEKKAELEILRARLDKSSQAVETR